MDDTKTDGLAYMTLANDHCAKIHSTNPLERLKDEIKCKTDVTSGSFL